VAVPEEFCIENSVDILLNLYLLINNELTNGTDKSVDLVVSKVER